MKNIRDLNDEELIDEYNDLYGKLNNSATEFEERLRIRLRLEDIEDEAKEREVDL